MQDFMFRLRVYDPVSLKSRSKKLRIEDLTKPINVFYDAEALAAIGAPTKNVIGAAFRCGCLERAQCRVQRVTLGHHCPLSCAANGTTTITFTSAKRCRCTCLSSHSLALLGPRFSCAALC